MRRIYIYIYIYMNHPFYVGQKFELVALVAYNISKGLSFHLLEWSISLSRNHFCSPPSFWDNCFSISILMMCGCKQPSHNTLPTCQHLWTLQSMLWRFCTWTTWSNVCMYVCTNERIELTIWWVLGKTTLDDLFSELIFKKIQKIE